jgi:hypothetical protein
LFDAIIFALVPTADTHFAFNTRSTAANPKSAKPSACNSPVSIYISFDHAFLGDATMSGTKAALKAAKAALDAKMYDDAVSHAQMALSLDKRNYFA